MAVITVSTSRYRMRLEGREFTDESGHELEKGLEERGYSVVLRELVSDDVTQIRRLLLELQGRKDLDVIILCGGTGITKDDVTIEAVGPLLEKSVDGFAELFRMLSYQSIGAAAMLTRAIAGKIGDKLVFCIPGSPDAAKTLVKHFADELPHAVQMARS